MGFLIWLKKILTFDPSVYKPPVPRSGDGGSEMTEGDFHSGPGGYSPNSPYPETFYGSSGSSDDLGNDEGDFNR